MVKKGLNNVNSGHLFIEVVGIINNTKDKSVNSTIVIVFNCTNCKVCN